MQGTEGGETGAENIFFCFVLNVLCYLYHHIQFFSEQQQVNLSGGQRADYFFLGSPGQELQFI